VSSIIHVIGCRVLESALRPLLEEYRPTSCRIMEYGLHAVPQRMAPQLQAAVDALTPPGVVLLGFGLCGNGLVGLRARGHTLVIPHVDDCIALLMGSYAAYVADFRSHAGTYYLSKGWLESGYHPVGQHREWSLRYGEAQARRIVLRLYENYRRVALVAFTPDELRVYRPQAEEAARFLGVDYDEILGSTTLLRRWLECAMHAHQDSDECVIIPPRCSVRQLMFVR
jgi:hypothetical protein